MSERRADPGLIPRRYGDHDVVGAANEITPARTRAAAGLIREGRTYHLGQVLTPRSPAQMWRYWQQTLVADRSMPQRAFGANEQTFIEDTVSGALHSGTHLDGLAHVGIGEHTYNGHRYVDIIGPEGVDVLGAEHIPAMCGRGVLLDVAAAAGVECLGPGEEIGPGLLERAEAASGVHVGSGDILIVHTGWGAQWESDPASYGASEPGITLDAARWCAHRRVAVIGADTWAVEVVPVVPGSLVFPVHQECIVRNGIYLLENVRTAELVRDGVTEFFCVLSPLHLKGATASMVAPVALR